MNWMLLPSLRLAWRVVFSDTPQTISLRCVDDSCCANSFRAAVRSTVDGRLSQQVRAFEATTKNTFNLTMLDQK